MIIKDPETFEKFKKIMKKIPVNAEIYVGHGKEEKNINDISSEEFLEKVMKWSNESKKGSLCGIYGCTEEPDKKCKFCGCAYCSEHIKIHFHHKDNEGIILRDVVKGNE